MLHPLARTWGLANLNRLWNIRSRLQNVTRRFSTGPREELVYEHTSPKQIMAARAFGFAQLLAWPYMVYSMNDVLKRKQNVVRNPEGDDTQLKRLSRKVAESSMLGTFQAVGVCIGIGLAVISAFICNQTVRRAFVVGRSHVRFETYGVVTPRHINVRINEISALRGRDPNKANYIPIKVADRAVYLLIDQHSGKFPMPRLYDMSVGVTRDL